MTKIKIKPAYIIAVVFISLLALIAMVVAQVSLDANRALKICGVLCLIHFMIMYFMYAKQEKKLITLYGMFLLSFFMFQCGQYVIYGFNMPYDYFYIEKYQTSVVIDSVIYSSMCNTAVFLAYGFVGRNDRLGKISKSISKRDENSIALVAFVCFWLVAIVDIPLTMVKFSVVWRSGYYGVRAFEDTLPSLFSLIDQMFIPFAVLDIMYANRRARVLCTSIAIVIWSLLTTLCGDRTSGIAGFLVLGLIVYYGFTKKYISVMQKKKRTIGFIVLCLFLGYLIIFAYKFRMQEGQLNFFAGITEIITEVFGTMGFSFFPLVLTMQVCPVTEGFLFGKSIFYSLLTGFFPASLDFTGLWDACYKLSKESYYWIENYYSYTFGLGYSLNAEAYSNFGYLGIIWIFTLGLIVNNCLKEPIMNMEGHKFENYKSLALLFAFFTMPRRSCFYLTNFILYDVVIVGLIIIMFAKVKRKNYTE